MESLVLSVSVALVYAVDDALSLALNSTVDSVLVIALAAITLGLRWVAFLNDGAKGVAHDKNGELLDVSKFAG